MQQLSKWMFICPVLFVFEGTSFAQVFTLNWPQEVLEHTRSSDTSFAVLMQADTVFTYRLTDSSEIYSDQYYEYAFKQVDNAFHVIRVNKLDSTHLTEYWLDKFWNKKRQLSLLPHNRRESVYDHENGIVETSITDPNGYQSYYRESFDNSLRHFQQFKNDTFDACYFTGDSLWNGMQVYMSLKIENGNDTIYYTIKDPLGRKWFEKTAGGDTAWHSIEGRDTIFYEQNGERYSANRFTPDSVFYLDKYPQGLETQTVGNRKTGASDSETWRRGVLIERGEVRLGKYGLIKRTYRPFNGKMRLAHEERPLSNNSIQYKNRIGRGFYKFIMVYADDGVFLYQDVWVKGKRERKYAEDLLVGGPIGCRTGYIPGQDYSYVMEEVEVIKDGVTYRDSKYLWFKFEDRWIPFDDFKHKIANAFKGKVGEDSSDFTLELTQKRALVSMDIKTNKSIHKNNFKSIEIEGLYYGTYMEQNQATKRSNAFQCNIKVSIIEPPLKLVQFQK